MLLRFRGRRVGDGKWEMEMGMGMGEEDTPCDIGHAVNLRKLLKSQPEFFQ